MTLRPRLIAWTLTAYLVAAFLAVAHVHPGDELCSPASVAPQANMATCGEPAPQEAPDDHGSRPDHDCVLCQVAAQGTLLILDAPLVAEECSFEPAPEVPRPPVALFTPGDSRPRAPPVAV